MNKLPIEKRIQIIKCLVEGNSLRSTSRLCDVAFNTVLKLLPEIGNACAEFHNEKVVNVKSQRVQADEIWSFIGSKEKNTSTERKEEGCGDVWTWTALDADSKLIVSWYVGERDALAANYFMHDVSLRLANRVQLTTDGHHAYLDAVDNAFQLDIDYATLIKLYGAPAGESQTERKYSPNECNGTKTKVVTGEPNPKFISTSYVERQNLTMRMHMRRFTRLTNAFSKKLENHCHAIALHFVYYNFIRIHKSLSVTPAMQAGLAKKPMTIEDIANLVPIDAPKKRGAYNKKKNNVL
ncbi:MAG: DDE-type integrase/transposase/recombinase [Chitinophagaceae bacterium]|nr:DDE-type integrase/transposase/recombinase [Chitinophagaceae bacterium]